MAKYIVINGIRIDKDYQNFVPETFGRLTTIGPRFILGKLTYQTCQCACGNTAVVMRQCLGKQTHSCGCLAKEVTRNRSITHGHGVHGKQPPEYRAWSSMHTRCYNQKVKSYPHYGGRGIEVCSRWKAENGGYLNFLEDMGPRPSPKHSVDRIDVNGDYCPENCRWATAKEQANNKRCNRHITAFGETKTISEWSRVYGVGITTINHRINKGWTHEQAVSQRPKGSTCK